MTARDVWILPAAALAAGAIVGLGMAMAGLQLAAEAWQRIGGDR